MAPTLTELIALAPWREAVTYRNTWPHEYVLSKKDDQRELIEAVCARFRALGRAFAAASSVCAKTICLSEITNTG